jgi:hypothetical protein
VKLVPVDVAALAFGVHVRTIWRWIKSGAPHLKLGGHVRVDLDAMRHWRDSA